MKKFIYSIRNVMVFEIKKFANRQFYFELKISTGQVITSEMYQTKQGARRGIKNMRINIYCAKFEDKTKDI